jgi:hypothetical protein
MASFGGEDDPRAAFEVSREGMELVERLGILAYATYQVGNALGTGEVLGEWDWVESAARRLAEISRDAWSRRWFEWVAATIATYRGEEHLETLTAMWEAGEAASDPQILGNAASALSRRAYVRGEFAASLDWIRRGRLASRGGWPANEIGFEGRVALLAGDPGALDEARADLVGRPGRRAVLVERAMLDAATAALAGRREEAVAGYRAVIGRYRDLGMRYWLALAVLDIAAALGPDAAVDLGAVDEARAILVELRSEPLVARLDELVGSAAGAGRP